MWGQTCFCSIVFNLNLLLCHPNVAKGKWVVWKTPRTNNELKYLIKRQWRRSQWSQLSCDLSIRWLKQSLMVSIMGHQIHWRSTICYIKIFIVTDISLNLQFSWTIFGLTNQNKNTSFVFTSVLYFTNSLYPKYVLTECEKLLYNWLCLSYIKEALPTGCHNGSACCIFHFPFKPLFFNFHKISTVTLCIMTSFVTKNPGQTLQSYW